MTLLIRERLTADNHDIVRLFCCGSDGVWCQHADSWIKAGPDDDGGAFYSMKIFGTHVWLYFDDISNEMVGFGSFGQTAINWPTPSGPRISVSYIPLLAIDRRFHGRPSEPGAIKYCHQLFQDLLFEAADAGKDRVVLRVDPENTKAIALYGKYDFHMLPGYQDKYGNVMMLKWLA
jgi:ribosomal protein S18 acetylase RimI-like enzyme